MIPMIALDQWMINFLKNNFDMVTGFIINGTIIALVYAYIIRFLAVAFNPLSSNQLKKSVKHFQSLLEFLEKEDWQPS